MPSAASAWEHGSEFHRLDFTAAARTAPQPWGADARYFGSGRDALRCLLAWGAMRRGWRRVWTPSYFCQNVIAAIVHVGLDLTVYADRPTAVHTPMLDLPFARGDVLFAVNYFGIRQPAIPAPAVRELVDVIEDHTHDPWSERSFHSDADFAMAALRKTLPLPDGAVLWSPKQEPLPEQPPVTELRRRAARQRLAGMEMKRRYLEGNAVDKERYRELLRDGECGITAGPYSGMTAESRELLDQFPLESWRAARCSNHRYLTERLAAEGMHVVVGDGQPGCPFSAILVYASSSQREFVRRWLIERHIYPAVLWPLHAAARGQSLNEDVELSARMLSLHCDMRYSYADMDRVAAAVLQANNEWNRDANAASPFRRAGSSAGTRGRTEQ